MPKISESLDEITLSLLYEALKLLQNEPYENGAAAYIYGAFLAVLASFSKLDTSQGGRKISLPVAETLEYIENNIESSLSIKSISKALGISPSLLSHEFKREMGITPHSYVMQKRLLLAKNLLKSGKKPCDVFSLCGYADYSSFYKAYTKAFGKRPKDF